MKQMLTIEKLDWNRLWSEDRQNCTTVRDQEHWNRRAPLFAQIVKANDNDDYVGPFLRIVNARPEWSVLDVGCGAGTLASPLAKIVRRVTAIDFSPAMIALLEKHKEAAGICNVTTHLARWEDDWLALGIEPHDVAIASRSLCSEDPRKLLEKLNSFARKSVYISCAVGDGPRDLRLFEAIGREAHANPDYIYIYNLLHQMGIFAHVSVIEKQTPTYANAEEAVDSLRWMVENMTPAEEEAMCRFLGAHLVPDGERWRLDYRRPVCWAVIWWKVAPRPV
jgi:SAM-dependent methyltransferase